MVIATIIIALQLLCLHKQAEAIEALYSVAPASLEEEIYTLRTSVSTLKRDIETIADRTYRTADTLNSMKWQTDEIATIKKAQMATFNTVSNIESNQSANYDIIRDKLIDLEIKVESVSDKVDEIASLIDG